MNTTVKEAVTRCQLPSCAWLSSTNLTNLTNVPPLLPDSDLSGIGVILGFSISAYLTLLLLIIHYITVHNVHQAKITSNTHTNAVDHRVLTFIRSRIFSWTPSRRFQYAIEKSVLILSDLNLVTGTAILVAGYSQLKCGISAYHWQMMVFISWFASFAFVSATAFLEGCSQTNKSMRLIRLVFMVLLASLLIAALLPTGSRMWLNGYPDDGEGFYPSLSTVCFYKELGMRSFLRRGPKIWSMIFSVVIVGVSFVRCGIQLLDRDGDVSRTCLRTLPGTKFKQFLSFLESKTLPRTIQAYIWHLPYLLSYASFIIARAIYDVSESMLLEILWLTFAMAWGTIKVWDTRAAASWNYDGYNFTLNQKISEENSWGFGQTLPLILLLLPLLSMAQAYLDDDAKAQEVLRVDGDTLSPPGTAATQEMEDPSAVDPDPFVPQNCNRLVNLPTYPYESFASHDWYHDHLVLLVSQIIMVSTVALFFLTRLADILGISSILRSRLFVIWILAILPLASFIHLAAWYLAALVVGEGMWCTGYGERDS
ncbi:uncharacterized protein J4E79_007797 [Alternaria viburni]|uniref:uncharacterized protein n=1 Tax=Alternaria viburni TaxID=566460 RepID=UPI0020C51627|nr:uncharacterized protein J4E79_007797 [Alternaria viburni]KAI4657181.1 hypothetical protein J4E79_007797 [Alternaria viburni]